MKLLAIVILLSVFTPGFALDNSKRDRVEGLNVHPYSDDIHMDYKYSMLEFKNGHQFAGWFDEVVLKPQAIQPTTVGKPYKLDDKSLDHVVACYFRRYWERKQYGKLSPAEAFCKRVSENKPNEAERQELVRFNALRTLWDNMQNITEIGFNPYSPSEDEKQEVEDCHFFRSWANKANPTTHDLFCKRLSDNEPNQIELLEKTAFQAYRELWTKMATVAAQDYAQINICFLVERKHIREPKDSQCNIFSQLVHNPNTWRDIRRYEVYRCMWSLLRKTRKAQCTETIKEYKRVYCQDGC